MSWLFGSSAPTSEEAKTAKSIFDFSVKTNSGSIEPLSQFRGKKAYIVVNVASEWGLTKQNYTELVQLHNKYSANGFEILAFPCNNFGKQEPGTDEQILAIAKSNFNVNFPLLGKLEVFNLSVHGDIVVAADPTRLIFVIKYKTECHIIIIWYC
jgi:glutathione peroxidase-family protein